MEVLKLGELAFEPLSEAHFPLLLRWLNSPHVAEVWDGAKTLGEARSKYEEKIASDWQRALIVSRLGERFGYIQSYQAARAGAAWWPHEPETTVGIDQFVGEAHLLGKGLGTAMVREFSDWLLRQPGVEKVITDPRPGNARAIACFRKAGFNDVRVIATPDGPALLMEKRARHAEG